MKKKQHKLLPNMYKDSKQELPQGKGFGAGGTEAET